MKSTMLALLMLLWLPARQDADIDALLARAASAPDPTFTDSFGEEAADFVPTGKNPYFILEPGYTMILEGVEDGKSVRIVVTVLAETKTIDGVETRVVTEDETFDGKRRELTRDYFAISARTNNVYYFGEDVDVFRKDGTVTHEGSWQSGKNGARYGLAMPGVPLIGARYQQETAPEVAMDRGEIVATDDRFECPAGKFEKVLVTEESTPLEKGKERKRYARGVGILEDGGALLVRYGMNLK